MGRESVEEDPGVNLACYGKKRDSSIVSTVCMVIFLVDGYNAGSFHACGTEPTSH